VQLTPKAAARLMQAIGTPASHEALTDRETDVLRLLARGYSNKQIAESLNNTEKTIKTHVSRILSKLGVQSRTQATLYAIRTGLVSPNAARQSVEAE
jgi:DNA-binding NarL/FixJ family response regulator